MGKVHNLLLLLAWLLNKCVKPPHSTAVFFAPSKPVEVAVKHRFEQEEKMKHWARNAEFKSSGKFFSLVMKRSSFTGFQKLIRKIWKMVKPWKNSGTLKCLPHGLPVFFFSFLLHSSLLCSCQTKIHAFKLAGIIRYEHEGPESSSRNLKVCFKSVLMMSVRSCGSQCLNYCKWKHNDQISNKIIITQNRLHLPAEGRMKRFLAAVNERHVWSLCLSAS